MSVSVSGSVSSIKNVTIGTTGKGEPNWSYIPSAGKFNKSKAEFTSEIKELAKRAALSTNKTESEYISRQVLQLRAEYLSDVAPDRKMLYQQAKNAMKNQNNNPKCRGIGELTLLDFLDAADGRGSSLAEKRFALAGGTLTCPILTTGGYGAVIECQGVKALSNTGNGWSYELDQMDQLGSSVESAINAANKWIYDLEHPLAGQPARSVEEQRLSMNERKFYEAFLEKLKGLL